MIVRSALAATVVALSSIAVLASPAAATTPSVLISAIYFDSPGSDRGGNTSVNAEWVAVHNSSRSARSLTHWTLRDRSNHVYVFPTYTLGAGRTVYVHTGRGTNTSTQLYWNQGYYIWNNSGDTAYLRTSTGASDDSCAYTSRSAPEAHC